MLIIHSPRCLAYSASPHPETPDRVARSVAWLRRSPHDWLEPTACTDADLHRVHSDRLINSVRSGSFANDDTPAFADIFELARLAAGAALLAGARALAGQPAFSLMRPPGHHATHDRAMGFCYFNNIAVSVARLLDEHHVPRIAILDFDCHHGNGTEDIFRNEPRVLFVSLQQFPCYPDTGGVSFGNCRNHPLPPGTRPAEFLAEFDGALAEIGTFAPNLLAVSAGFDMYKDDPITDMNLEIDTFHEIGRRLAALAVPTFAVLEGGYSAELPECIAAFVKGWCP